MMKHWDITENLGVTIEYCADEFVGISLNAGYSKITGCIQIHFQLGGLAIAVTYYVGE